MYQRFIAVGRLGRDPEFGTTSNGVRYANLRLATSEYIKGEERTEWHRVVVWDEMLIEVLQRRARKGTMVAIEGQIRSRKWLKDGQEVTTTEVVLDRFHSRLQILTDARREGGEGGEEANRRTLEHAREVEFEDDELPF